MWIVLISLLGGIVIGALKIIPEKYLNFNPRFQQIGTVLTLFFVGLSIGSDKEIICKLKLIGLEALVFAVFTSVFSIIATYIITEKFLKF